MTGLNESDKMPVMTSDTRPWLLDLFCGAGGAAKGYQEAGFRVHGVDISPQPYYIGDRFSREDALEVLRGETRIPLSRFSVIHASPPCQSYSIASNFRAPSKLPRKHRPKLVNTVRFLLQTVKIHTGTSHQLGRPTPWVIENVKGAPLDPAHTIMLCGTSFGLPLIRHRFFESNVPLLSLPCEDHTGAIYSPVGHAYMNTRLRNLLPEADRKHWTDRCRTAMGIHWMSIDELTEAIPPAYTELIGNQLMSYLTHPSQARNYG